MDLILKYLDNQQIPYKVPGKLIIATNPSEIETIQNLYDRGVQNGVQNLKILNTIEEIRLTEPKCKGEYLL